MVESYVLVHAPVLGPGSWAMVAGELARRGHQVTVLSLAGFTEGRPPYVPRLVRRATEQIAEEAGPDAVLVVHSGAGVFAPYLAEAIAGRCQAVVFADAGLPPESGNAIVVEAEFLPFLQGIAHDGVVPPWPRWWPDEDLSPLFPDEVTRENVLGEAHALPLAFFEEALPPVPTSWRSQARAYLRFSEGYREPARQAAARGWPVAELPGEHLHMLIDPLGVAAAITGLRTG
jgi:hypothetical protein